MNLVITNRLAQINIFKMPYLVKKGLDALVPRWGIFYWRMIMSKWQPIETAPKDGTSILVAGKYSADPQYIEVAHFDSEENMFMKGYKTTVGDAWLTHWMPLPVPPKE